MDMQVAETELLDIVSVGRSLPGTMIGNVAYLFGFRRCGKGRSPARSVTRCARGACVLSAVFAWNCALIIVLGAATGLLMGRWKGGAPC